MGDRKKAIAVQPRSTYLKKTDFLFTPFFNRSISFGVLSFDVDISVSGFQG